MSDTETDTDDSSYYDDYLSIYVSNSTVYVGSAAIDYYYASYFDTGDYFDRFEGNDILMDTKTTSGTLSPTQVPTETTAAPSRSPTVNGETRSPTPSPTMSPTNAPTSVIKSGKMYLWYDHDVDVLKLSLFNYQETLHEIITDAVESMVNNDTLMAGLDAIEICAIFDIPNENWCRGTSLMSLLFFYLSLHEQDFLFICLFFLLLLLFDCCFPCFPMNHRNISTT